MHFFLNKVGRVLGIERAEVQQRSSSSVAVEPQRRGEKKAEKSDSVKKETREEGHGAHTAPSSSSLFFYKKLIKMPLKGENLQCKSSCGNSR